MHGYLVLLFTGALMITSGLVMHISVAAMLIQTPPTLSSTKVITMQEDPTSHSNNNISVKLNTEKHQDSVSHLTRRVFKFDFILLMINSFMFLFGTAVLFTHIKAFAESEGISSSVGSLMISFLGFTALVGRIALSMISQLPWVNTIVLYIVAVLLCGKCHWRI